MSDDRLIVALGEKWVMSITTPWLGLRVERAQTRSVLPSGFRCTAFTVIRSASLVGAFDVDVVLPRRPDTAIVP